MPEEQKPFSWETSERIDLKNQLIQQHEYVFINIPFKGYNPDKDVRYALSSDEILIEIRDKDRIQRLTQTLDKTINIEGSDV